MVKVNKLLKTILTTTSTLAAINSISSHAIAVSRTSQGNTDTSNAAGFLPVGFNNGDTLIFGGNHTVEITNNTGPFPAVVDFQNNAGIFYIHNGINITLNSILKSTGGTNGELKIDDPGTKVTFSGIFDATNKIQKITVGNNTNLDVTTNIDIGQTITLSGNGAINFGNGVTVNATKILPDSPNDGVINFQGDVVVNAYIGNIAQINNINIGSGKVTYTPDNLSVIDINLTNSNSIFHIAGNGKQVTIDGTINNTTGISGNGTISVSEDLLILSDVGTSAQRLAALTFEADKLFTIQPNGGTFDYYVNQTAPSASLGSGKGSMLAWYSGNKDIDVNFGTPTLKLKYFSYSETDDVLPVVDSIATLKQGRSIYAEEIDLYPFEFTAVTLPRAILNVENNTTIDAEITTRNASLLGEVAFSAGSTVKRNIGRPGNDKILGVYFNSNNKNDVVNFSGDIYAVEIKHAKTNLNIPKDVIFDAAYSNKESTVSLGLNTLTFKGAHNHVMDGDVVLNIQASETKAGNITINGGVMNLSKLAPVTQPKGFNLHLADTTTTIPTDNVFDVDGNRIREFTILNTINGGNITIPNNNDVSFVIASSTNPFIQWKYSDGKIRQTLTKDIIDLIDKTAQQKVNDPIDSKNASLIIQSQSDLTNDLIQELINGNPEEFIRNFQLSITEATETVYAARDSAIQTVSNRISSISLPGTLGLKFNVAENNVNAEGGVSAGDELEPRYGAWSSYSAGYTSQRQVNKSPGYRSRSQSLTIGTDTLINDDITVGAAVSTLGNIIHHRDNNLGDKTKTTSYVGSLYYMHEFTNNWFFQSVGVAGKTFIKNAEGRGSNRNLEIAVAKFHSASYGLELMSGYNYLHDENLLITPMFGLEYNFISKTSYQESGTKNFNLDVHKKPDQKLDAKLQLRLTKNFRSNGYDITPEIHCGVRRDLLDHKLKITARLSSIDLPLVLKTAELNKTIYNVGSSVTTAYKNIDLGAGYDFYQANRYLSHQGTLKLRVNF